MPDNDNEFPRSKAEAKSAGAEAYYTGIPCKRGHLSIRHVRGECLECKSAYYEENKERISLQKKEYRAKNIGVARERNRAHYRRNSGLYYQRALEWRAANPEKYSDSVKKSSDKRRATPGGKLHHAVSSNISRGLVRGGKNGRKAFSLLGYTLIELMAHLEKRFLPGMSWDNYGEWHIDHIVPVSAHNFETPEDIDFKKCWALKNLQPLWASDNISKNAKLFRPFQPSLALAEITNDNHKIKEIA